jgi:benzoyl-CoA reductase/2-hydroxyglutaryl-CoA dehydratase subunit BcrC/BadD/HgdB
MSALAMLQEACAHPLAAAEAAKATGLPVIAYLGSSVPVELIRAAGAFAVQLAGDPALETPLADLYLDPEFDGEIRSLFDQIGSGACKVADLIVIPRSSNGLLYLYYSLIELRRLDPQREFPELLLYDVLNTPNWSTGRYVLGRTRALHEHLGGSAPQLRAAIAEANAVRGALHALDARRRAGRLSGSTWWCALRAARLLDAQDWFDAVRALGHEAAPQRRLMLKGFGQDTPELFLLAESLGANVVADDYPGGTRSVLALVDETAEPLAALAEHYQLHVPTIRSYPQAREDAAWLALLDESAAQGVVFYHEEFDDTLGWDYPHQKALLDARGLPHLLLGRQSYRQPDRAERRAALLDLIERIPA